MNKTEYFSVDDGLSNNIISSITQDKYGFLWIATANGLNRYDGYEFRIYRNEPGNAHSIGSNVISQIYKDKNEQLWIISSLEVDKYIYDADHFIRVVQTSSHSDQMILNVTERNDSLMFMFNDSCFTIHNDKITRSVYKGNSKSVTGIKIRDYKNALYSFTAHGNNLRIIPDLRNETPINVFCKSFSFDRISIRSGFIDYSNILWIGTISGLYKINLTTKPFHHLILTDIKGKGFTDNAISAVLEDNKERLWLGTQNNGLLMWSKKDNTHYVFRNNPGSPHILIGNCILSLLQDRQGVIWAGGMNLLRYDEGKRSFDFFQQDYNWPNTIYGWVVRDLLEDKKGNLWVETLDGITCINPERDHFTIYKPSDLDSSRNLIKLFWRIGEDAESNIWIPTEANLIILDHNTYKPSIEEYHPDDTTSLVSQIQCVYKDNDDQLWFASENRGLFKYQYTKTDKRKSRHIFKNYSSRNGFPSDDMYSILDDGKGNLWVGTSKGLCCFNKRSKNVKIYDISDGIPANHFITNSCYGSRNGMMYFGTDNGLVYFHPDSIKSDSTVPTVVLTKLKLFNKEIRAGDVFNHHIILQSDISILQQLELNYKENAITFEFSALHFSAPHKNKYAYRLIGFHDEWIYTDAGHRYAVYTSLPSGTYTFQVKASNNDGVWNEKGVSLKLIIRPPFWQTWWFRLILASALAFSIYIIFRMRVRTIEKQKKILENQVRSRTAEVVAQKEEIQTQAEILKEVNHTLEERNEEVNLQAEELSKLNATKDKFFSIIAHDLKNPFQGIIGLSDILITRFNLLSEKEKSEYILNINTSSKSTFTLLDNLLTWARTQTNSIHFLPEPVSVHAVVEETRRVLNLNIQNKKISFINEVQPQHCVLSDKNMLATVIRNLISNAVKFTPEKGTVKVVTEKSGDKILIRISDTGIGMNAMTKEKIFRVGQHHTTPGTAGETGTGLGLIICREYIIRNEGTIDVESEPGKGSEFIIKLPESSEIPVKAGISVPETESKEISYPDIEKTEQEEIVCNNKNKKILLIIDDDPAIRSSVLKETEDEYQVVLAENGMEGFKQSIGIIPDLIISDVTMPEMNGFELCEKLKKEKRTSHIPIILLTANDTDRDKMTGLETGADDYITKPFNIQLLKIRIRNLIKLREELQNLYRKKIISIEPVNTELKNTTDQKFIDTCIKSIEKDLSNSEYSIDTLAADIGMSRAQMYRKFEGMLNITPNMFIRNYRLKKAAEFLLSGENNITEVCYRTGFSNPTIFRKWFQEQFGSNPSVFAKQYKGNA